MFKKAVNLILAAGTALCALCLPCFAEGLPVDSGSSKSSIVIECSTGQVLCEENSRERLPIASVTKLMCLLLWAEDIKNGALNFSDTIRCSEYAGSMDGSVIWLEAGDEMTVEELLKAVVIASANDACVALAENSAGSEEAFVKRMNEKAQLLGMSDTSFANCVGYDDSRHFSTAYDIAVLCAEISRYDYYDAFYGTRLEYIDVEGREVQLLNTNKMMQYYNGILGGKTGTTDNAGCCLAVWAKRGDMTLAAVELGCTQTDERFDICERLLDYGFANFQMFRPNIDGARLTPVEIKNGIMKQTDVRVKKLVTTVIPKGSAANVKYDYKIVTQLTAPVAYGQKAGSLTATLDGEVIFTSDIVTVKEVDELNFVRSFLIILCNIFTF